MRDAIAFSILLAVVLGTAPIAAVAHGHHHGGGGGHRTLVVPGGGLTPGPFSWGVPRAVPGWSSGIPGSTPRGLLAWPVWGGGAIPGAARTDEASIIQSEAPLEDEIRALQEAPSPPPGESKASPGALPDEPAVSAPNPGEAGWEPL